jgi:hypothetical protein
LTKWPQNSKWRQKLHFLNFALKTSIFNRFQKTLLHSKRASLSYFYRLFFSKIRNGGFFIDDVIFEKKSTVFQTGCSHPKQKNVQIWKKTILEYKDSRYTKKIAKEYFPRWRIFSKWRLYSFTCHIWNMREVLVSW